MSTLAADVPVYRVVVQDAREVADAIADDLGIKHETPQAVILAAGDATFDTSHYRVQEETLRDALDDVTAPTDE
jgi:bacillithiol system protein YtxJ